MATTLSELMQQARAQVREVSPREAQELARQGALLIDVRERDEWEEGHIPGALHVPRSSLELRIEQVVPERDRPLVLYCPAGIKSLLAGTQLKAMGYVAPISMIGGSDLWRAEGLPWTAASGLTGDQQRRYSRHLLMPEIGSEGQARLLGARVLVVGAGGLGSPAMLYLAAAGVGTIGIVDPDVVDVSNLQRQVIHTTDRVGVRKVESAAHAIRALNPDVNVEIHGEMLTEENADRLIAGHDIVLDAVDTFESRYVLNDAAVRAGTTLIHGSVFRFEGQLTVIKPREGPCYRCLYPAPPPPDLAPGCAVAGVLGVVPGVIGLLQATEALKLLLGIGEPLVGRLLLWDALEGTFDELKLRRDPDCPVCGAHAREGAGAAIRVPNETVHAPSGPAMPSATQPTAPSA